MRRRGLRILGRQNLRGGARRERMAEPPGKVLVLGVVFLVLQLVGERGGAHHLRRVASLKKRMKIVRIVSEELRYFRIGLFFGVVVGGDFVVLFKWDVPRRCRRS